MQNYINQDLFINTFHNNPTLDNLYILLNLYTKSNNIIIATVSEVVELSEPQINIYHVNKIYESKLKIINSLFRLQDITQLLPDIIFNKHIFKNSIIYYDSNYNFNTYELFIVESFINIFYHEHITQKNTQYNKYIINNLINTIKNPLNNILHLTSSNLSNSSDPAKPAKLADPAKPAKSADPAKPANLSNSQIKKYVNILSDGIFDIIDDLQINISELKLNFISFSLRELIREIDMLIIPHVKNNVKYKSFIYDDVPEYIYTDRSRLKQILINLLKKSVSHTIKGEINIIIKSVCHIDCENENIKYKISFAIKDTGIGIPKDKIKNLLNSTYNSSSDLLSSSSSGTINLCYSLSKLLGGELKINNYAGSTFQLDLILFEEQPPEFDHDTLKKIKNNKILLFKKTGHAEHADFEDIINILKIYNITYTYISSVDEIITLYNNIGNIAIIDLEHIKDYNKIINLNIPVIGIVSKINKDLQYIDYDNIDYDNIVFSPIDDYIFKNQLLKITNISKLNKKREFYIMENTIDDCNVIKNILEKLGFTKINLYHDINNETVINIKSNSIIFLNDKLKNINSKMILEKIQANLTQANLRELSEIIYISNNPNHKLSIEKPITISKIKNIFDKFKV